MMDINTILGRNKVVRNKVQRLKPAFASLQNQWGSFSTAEKSVMRMLHSDADCDGVPNRWDCQPRNPMMQDSKRRSPFEKEEYFEKIADRIEKKQPNKWYTYYGHESIEPTVLATKNETTYDEPIVIQPINDAFEYLMRNEYDDDFRKYERHRGEFLVIYDGVENAKGPFKTLRQAQQVALMLLKKYRKK